MKSKIFGIGVDIVEVARVNRILEKFPKLANFVLSSKELQIFNSKKDKVKYISKRWAIKEAIGKAIGMEIANRFTMNSISILNDGLGKPFLDLSDIRNPAEFDHFKAHLSISDEREYVVGFCIIEVIE